MLTFLGIVISHHFCIELRELNDNKCSVVYLNERKLNQWKITSAESSTSSHVFHETQSLVDNMLQL